jgi:SAM-dependent methyltransferase
MRARWRLRLKRVLFPGLDLHTRYRCRQIGSRLVKGDIETLDAGCGNGALSLIACAGGNRVLGVSIDEAAVARAREYADWTRQDPERVRFEVLNLYDLATLGRRFDQVICSETLEHISDDRAVIRAFHSALREDGVLHLCCPNAMHPSHNLGRTDGPEDGGHVRDGYTLEAYRALLEPAGFEIVETVGLGSPRLAAANRIVSRVRNRWGDALALPVFVLALPCVWLDRVDPPTPFSLYVRALKRASQLESKLR